MISWTAGGWHQSCSRGVTLGRVRTAHTGLPETRVRRRRQEQARPALASAPVQRASKGIPRGLDSHHELVDPCALGQRAPPGALRWEGACTKGGLPAVGSTSALWRAHAVPHHSSCAQERSAYVLQRVSSASFATAPVESRTDSTFGMSKSAETGKQPSSLRKGRKAIAARAPPHLRRGRGVGHCGKRKGARSGDGGSPTRRLWGAV